MKSVHSLIRLSVLFLALAAPKFSEATECHCQIVKSDCGDCSQKCVAKDFGNIDSVKLFSTNKQSTCTDACNLKLNAISQGDACTALSSNLGVPLPWGGQIQACSRVGILTRRTGARKNITCAADSTGVNYDSASYWKMTLDDEFKGKPSGASPSIADCYDRKASCALPYSGNQDCPATVANQLKDLNKCLWTVMDKDNWMSSDINAFDSREVSVDPNLDDGVLILHAHAVQPNGTYFPVAKRPNLSYIKNKKLPKGYDCFENDSWTHNNCPFLSGGVSSNPNAANGPPGFKQAYGRFEVRSKISSGAGSWPAIWGTGVGPWPGAGELDLLESYNTGWSGSQTLHVGVCTPENKLALDFNSCTTEWHESKGVNTKFYELPKKSLLDQAYHVYSVEWDPEKIIFSIDGKATNTIHALDPIRAGYMQGVKPKNSKDLKQTLPAQIPSSPFFFILNISIAHHGSSGQESPDPTHFYPQMMFIDWVHAYQRCTTQEDFCPSGGGFDPKSGYCSDEFAKVSPGKKEADRKIASSAPYLSPCQK